MAIIFIIVIRYKADTIRKVICDVFKLKNNGLPLCCKTNTPVIEMSETRCSVEIIIAVLVTIN